MGLREWAFGARCECGRDWGMWWCARVQQHDGPCALRRPWADALRRHRLRRRARP